MVTLTMWMTTGTGEAKNRAFCGVMAAPPVSSVSRAAPAITGIRLRRIRAAGTGHCGPGRLTDWWAILGLVVIGLVLESGGVRRTPDGPNARCTGYTCQEVTARERLSG